MNKWIKNRYEYIRYPLFLLLGIATLVCNRTIMTQEGRFLSLFVGVSMLLFGADSAVILFIHKGNKHARIHAFSATIHLVFGVLTLTVANTTAGNIKLCCLLWAIWALVREGEEIWERVIATWQNKLFSLLSLAESLVVGAFSVELLLLPVLHHAHTHVIILGCEFLLEFVLPLLQTASNGWFKKGKTEEQ